MKKTLIALLLVSSLVNAKIYDGIAVVVQNKAITLYDIEKVMQSQHLDAQHASELLIRQKLEDILIQQKKITITQEEVYNDIKQMAQRNHLSVGEFYDAVRESNGLSSSELKEKIKEKLLRQKLYANIAMQRMGAEPSDEELRDFYELHKKEFRHPESFEVTVYESNQKQKLQAKVANPMMYDPTIAQNTQVLPYNRISPELASLLQRTPPYHFTPIIPNGKGGFLTFYVQKVNQSQNQNFENVKEQVLNLFMNHKREKILSDYFARMKDNSEINIIRLP